MLKNLLEIKLGFWDNVLKYKPGFWDNVLKYKLGFWDNVRNYSVKKLKEIKHGFGDMNVCCKTGFF